MSDADWLPVLEGCGRVVTETVRAAQRHQQRAELATDEGLGADGDPTTRLDALAEIAALAFLERQATRPGSGAATHFNVLSEECGLIDRGAPVTLVIDPIDSTNNAITGFPYFAFSIAAVVDQPRAACVINLPTGDTWTAVAGGGAYLNGQVLHGSGVATIDQAIMAAVRPMTEADLLRLQAVLFEARRLRITGCTALDLCLIASGSLHGFINPNRYTRPTWGEKIVDYAGAALILTETGGALCDQTGQPLQYPLDLRHRLSLQAAATPELLAALMLTQLPDHWSPPADLPPPG